MHWTSLLSLVPVVVLAFSGLLMQLVYHMGRHPLSYLFWGLDKTEWSWVHKICATICLLLIAYHLYLHWNWLKTAVSKRRSNSGKRMKRNSLWLSIIFLLAAISSAISWLIIIDRHLARHVIEIHDKLGILLAILIIVHFIQHYTWFKKLLLYK